MNVVEWNIFFFQAFTKSQQEQELEIVEFNELGCLPRNPKVAKTLNISEIKKLVDPSNDCKIMREMKTRTEKSFSRTIIYSSGYIKNYSFVL
ncbi:hypothetical protein RIR_jg21670.t1 [Rhizophagus irregularis DAOM 181602=DAOM 197198]|nr:hypothetical protein RIR_jg21670.t1 [Rhizophagus irregularis DAOM 181602=DAOM 197198]